MNQYSWPSEQYNIFDIDPCDKYRIHIVIVVILESSVPKLVRIGFRYKSIRTRFWC